MEAVCSSEKFVTSIRLHGDTSQLCLVLDSFDLYT
jgi:hypothetical protein